MIAGAFFFDKKSYYINGSETPISKYPKLIELYNALFEENQSEKHNAVFDTMITAKCFTYFCQEHHIIYIREFDKDGNPKNARII